MKIQIKYLLSLILLLSLISPVLAIGISPGKYELEFKPYDFGTFSFTAINNVGVDGNYEAYVRDLNEADPISKYLDCYPKTMFIQAGKGYVFVCNMTLPGSLEPGYHEARIGVIDATPKKVEGIQVRTAVETRFIIRVAYPDFWLELNVHANNTKAGEIVPIEVKIRNWGKQPVTLAVAVDIFDFNGTKIASLQTESKTIDALKEESLSAEWPANAPPGKYKAVARYNYNGKEFNSTSEFVVGGIKINFLDLYSNLTETDQVSKFQVILESMWPETIDFDMDFRALSIDNRTMGTKQQSLRISPWAKQNFEVFLEPAISSPGNYSANIKLSYAGKTEEKIYSFAVSSKNERPGLKINSGTALAAGIIAALVIAVGVFLGVVLRRRTQAKIRKK